MKAASLKELRDEIKHLPPETLQDLCVRLAKYKKENKELITYLLFESNDEEAYIQSVKDEMDELFEGINFSQLFYIKKTLRKILRTANKFIKYSGKKTTELEILIHFLKKMRHSKIPVSRSPVLQNMYLRQYQKIKKTLDGLHPDLQLDYEDEIDLLQD